MSINIVVSICHQCACRLRAVQQTVTRGPAVGNTGAATGDGAVLDTFQPGPGQLCAQRVRTEPGTGMAAVLVVGDAGRVIWLVSSICKEILIGLTNQSN